jgi:general secretion pathway protein D
LVLTGVTAVAPAWAVSVSFLPSTTVVGLGQAFSIGVAITDVTDLFAFQFDIAFAPSIVRAIATSEGGLLPSGGATLFEPGSVDNVAGTITFTADTLVGPIPGVSGSGTLVTLSFTSLAVGTSPITLSNVTLLNSTLTEIPATIVGGTITVVPNVVPEASTLVLLGSAGLAVGVRLCLRRHAT